MAAATQGRAIGEGIVARLVLFGLVAAMLFGVACGGGSDQPSISEAEAVAVTNTYLKTTLGLFTGTTDAQTFIDQYAPECRADIDASAMAFVSAFMQGLAPELKDVDVEAVDVGRLKLEETDDGVLVIPEDPAAMRITVDGQSMPANEFFAQAGFVPIEEDDLGDPVLLVRRDGQVYLGDCSELKDLAGGAQPTG